MAWTGRGRGIWRRALSVEEQRELLRAAEESTARDRAIVGLSLFAGLRLAEAAARRPEDVRMSAREGVVVVRSGEGDVYREVPLNALVRRLLEEWLEVRRTVAAETERAFWSRAWAGR